MLRRSLFALTLGTVFAASAKVEASAPKPAAKEHKLALQVSDNDPVKFVSALQVAVNALNFFSDKGELCDVSIVAFGDGVGIFRSDSSPVKDKIIALQKSFPSLSFVVCKNTLTYMSKKEVRQIDVINGVEIVQAGIGRLVELSEQGYSIVRI